MKAVLVFLLGIIITHPGFAQSTQPKFEDIRKQFYKNHEREREKNKSLIEEDEEGEDGELTRFHRWEWLMQSHLMPDGTLPDPTIAAREREAYFSSHPGASVRNATWTQVGTLTGTIAGAGRINVIRIDPG